MKSSFSRQLNKNIDYLIVFGSFPKSQKKNRLIILPLAFHRHGYHWLGKALSHHLPVEMKSRRVNRLARKTGWTSQIAIVYGRSTATYPPRALPVDEEAVLVHLEQAVWLKFVVILLLGPPVEDAPILEHFRHRDLPVELESLRHGLLCVWFIFCWCMRSAKNGRKMIYFLSKFSFKVKINIQIQGFA